LWEKNTVEFGELKHYMLCFTAVYPLFIFFLPRLFVTMIVLFIITMVDVHLLNLNRSREWLA